MKVLWITNILFPEAESLLKNENKQIKSTGGWMIGAADALCDYSPSLELIVATVSSMVKNLTVLQGEKRRYIIIPYGKGNVGYNKDYEKYWIQVKNEIKPDVVHIHGTEFSHGLAYIRACTSKNVVVSIQGLVSIYYRYYYYGLSNAEKKVCYGPFNIFRGTKYDGQYRYKIQTQTELQILKSVNHVIGRTNWDKIHTWYINSQLEYHFCNETLRRDFYQGTWSYQNCTKHTIFLSQGNKPIKGLLQTIKALPKIMEFYPDTKLIVAGENIISNISLKKKLFGGFSYLVWKTIKDLGLQKFIHFTGPLDSVKMKEELLKSNVFVCPSSIENSPNSLGEAQLLGVPCISSSVGGVSDMIPNQECGLQYRFDEYEQLAFLICEVFKKSGFFINDEERKIAHLRHNVKNNAEQTVKIYKEIMSAN